MALPLVNRTPIILLAGQAGSGKDTVGAYIAGHYGGVTLAYADPMKRFLRRVFAFTEDQLWGPSELRNVELPITTLAQAAIEDGYDASSAEFVQHLVPDPSARGRALELLDDWFGPISAALEEGQPISPRSLLQTLGTDWGRRVSREMWSEYAHQTCLRLLEGSHTYSRTGGLQPAPHDGYDFTILTDGRFRNEVLRVRMAGGLALKIVRGQTASSTVGIQGHASEREPGAIPNHFFTAVVENHYTLKALYARINEIVTDSYAVRRLAA